MFRGTANHPFGTTLLTGIAALQTVVYGAFYWLSGAFRYGSSEQDRPILLVLALLAVSFALYIVAIRIAVVSPATSRLKWAILLPAILFRAILLPTTPVQEIDIYRYLWDGTVTVQGVNPYRFPPGQVLGADAETNANEGLQRLVQLRDSSPELADILHRIHFAELPTVYPPVSQAVFALGDWISPNSASVEARVLILKSLIVLFDVGTIGVLWMILKRMKRHPGWTVAYAWCPLVLKEFANTGHLDAIAVFFTVACVWCIVELLEAVSKPPGTVPIFPSLRGKMGLSPSLEAVLKPLLVSTGERCSTAAILGCSVLFSLAIGAKLYPLVLAPLFVITLATKLRTRHVALFIVLTTIFSGLLVAPMLLTTPANASLPASPSHSSGADASTSVSVSKQETGLGAFLTRWEMNDFLFMIVVENLRPEVSERQQPRAWFSVVPDAWRETCIRPLAGILHDDAKTSAFLVARGLTTCIFLVIAAGLALRVYRAPAAPLFLEAAFLTLAWFWLLAPTQNPWYWTWALPLLPFVRGRAWYGVSGLVLIYYLRFWLRYHFPAGPVCGTAYNGVQFFDFVVTWLEYAPWFVWLTVAAAWRRLHP